MKRISPIDRVLFPYHYFFCEAKFIPNCHHEKWTNITPEDCEAVFIPKSHLEQMADISPIDSLILWFHSVNDESGSVQVAARTKVVE